MAFDTYAQSAAERIKRRRNQLQDANEDAEHPAVRRRLLSPIKQEHDVECPRQEHTPAEDSTDVLPDRDPRNDSIKPEAPRPHTLEAKPDTAPQAQRIVVLRVKDIYDISEKDFANRTRHVLKKAMHGRKHDMGYYQMRRITRLLEVAKAAEQHEGPWLKNDEAATWLKNNAHDRPIFSSQQQPLSLMSVKQVLSEFYDDHAEIWIQDPNRMDFDAGTYTVPIRRVKDRFRYHEDSSNPWNCLELAAPVEDGTRPQFLNDEDFRLLTKIKTPSTQREINPAQLSRRYFETGHKELEKWMLLAQAGALTNPHQDSHGFSSYITVNEGLFGFGWLHCPTADERQAWLKNPGTYIGGSWRYRLLKPGDTVYFPTGQVHFVFRHPKLGHTLAFGGHVLRCSTIVQWIKTMREQIAFPFTTNEEWTSANNSYVQEVATFVKQALESGDTHRIDKWGGEGAIKEFLEQKELLEGSTLIKSMRRPKQSRSVTVSTR